MTEEFLNYYLKWTPKVDVWGFPIRESGKEELARLKKKLQAQLKNLK